MPAETEFSAPFWEGTSNGVLKVVTCQTCGHRWLPPAGRCPACLGADLEWKDVNGRGRIWSWIVMHRSYFPEFKDQVPYPVLFIELEEGPMMMLNLANDSIEPACDMQVAISFVQDEGGRYVPVCEPVAS